MEKQNTSIQQLASCFDELIMPLGRDAFLADYWGTTLLHQPGGAGQYSDTLSWQALTDLLETQRFAVGNLRLVEKGKSLDVERYAQRTATGEQLVLKSAALTRCLTGGATLVMNHVEERVPALRQLADAVGDDLRANTTINLYASFGAQEGFDLHWDSQENFILQLAGRKYWKVYRPTREDPIKDELDAAPTPTGAPSWEGVLEAGDLLYLPRGWWHIARPLEGPSLHLTLTVEPPLGGHLLEWLAAELRSHPLARMNVPHMAAEAEQADYVERLLKAFVDSNRDALLQRFLAARDSAIVVRPRLPLPAAAAARPASLHAGSRLRLAVGRRLAISALEDPTQVAVWAGNRHWRAAAALVPALLALRATSAVSLADLDACLASPQSAKLLRVFLSALILAGVVDVE